MPRLDDPSAAALEEAAAEFASLRPRLFGIAYRMLGSAAEAEDIVQEAWLRWQNYDRDTVRDPPAFLATTTTRLAINALRSARARRETYVGPWLPEPVDTSADPALGAETGEALEFAILVLMEKLSPTERAAYVLREAFHYPYEQIAGIVQATEDNARQLVSRARKRVATQGRETVRPTEQRRMLTAFLNAARKGDLSALEEVLAADVVSYSDGGGAVRAAKIPVSGRTTVAKFVAAFAPTFWTGAELTWIEANGRPAVLASRDGAPFVLVTISADSAGVEQVMWVMNPAKLARISTARPTPAEPTRQNPAQNT
ncbi:RNA polymerase sigma-70 factor [Catellatospora paridis]|uniref:RNA polymerase sigma-70 factor n=1 Tax=Catellatospora paridis TaxID=1617086 RepID=UPI0012D4ABB1|nr:RNA polymerase sigma-70 factor [Catellatospora paridis]